MTRLYLDIETIPSQLERIRDYVSDNVEHPKNIKKDESIKKWYDEKFHDAVDIALDKTALDGAFCHVVSIGYAIDQGEVNCLQISSIDDEDENLETFFNLVDGLSYPTFIGHNILNFDLKVLRQRAMVLGVPVPRNIPFKAKPWDNNPYDTMLQWDAKDYVSLDKLATAFGLEGKGDIDGSQVHKLWKAGKFEMIKEYCISDVAKVRRIARHMLGDDLDQCVMPV